MRPLRRAAAVALALVTWASAPGSRAQEATAADPALASAVADPGRSPRFVARDPVRHPAEVLSFIGIKPSDTVVELWPTGGYWTEILAPYLAEKGQLYAALEYRPADSPERAAALKRDSYFADRLAGDPHRFGGIKLTAFGPGRDDMAPAGSVDVIFGFRTLHQWMKAGFAEDALVDCFQALKPGGVLALEDHRGNRTVPQDEKALDGYVNQDWAIGQAELAGFKLLRSSDIEANPKDTANWPRGVYTLAPVFALGDEDRARYAAIGEPDDFVLAFVKPK